MEEKGNGQARMASAGMDEENLLRAVKILLEEDAGRANPKGRLQ